MNNDYEYVSESEKKFKEIKAAAKETEDSLKAFKIETIKRFRLLLVLLFFLILVMAFVIAYQQNEIQQLTESVNNNADFINSQITINDNILTALELMLGK